MKPTMSLRIAILFYLLAIATPTIKSEPTTEPPSLKVEPRIVGGIEAVPHEFPFQISFQYANERGTAHLCGGSILNENWILTAAHCPMAVTDQEHFQIKAGKHSLAANENGEQTIKVAQVFNHKRYPGNVAPFDISLLKLEKPLKFSDTVKPISLSEPFQDVNGEVITIGWGSTHPSGEISYPDKLRKASLPIVDLNTCKKMYTDPSSGVSPVAISNVCTGPLDYQTSACSGDSGGPLIKKTNNKVEIVGIASWVNFPCGTRGTPAVYTKVSYYNDWIELTMAMNNVGKVQNYVIFTLLVTCATTLRNLL